jgi:hypothetical protein
MPTGEMGNWSRWPALTDCTGQLGVYYDGRFHVIAPNDSGYFRPLELGAQKKAQEAGKTAKAPPTLFSGSQCILHPRFTKGLFHFVVFVCASIFRS